MTLRTEFKFFHEPERELQKWNAAYRKVLLLQISSVSESGEVFSLVENSFHGKEAKRLLHSTPLWA